MEALKNTGIDLSNQGPAVHDALWSTATRFGPGSAKKGDGAFGIFSSALSGKDASRMSSQSDIVAAVQDYKAANNSSLFRSSSAAVQSGTLARAASEKGSLLRLAAASSVAGVAPSSLPSMPAANVPSSVPTEIPRPPELKDPPEQLNSSAGAGRGKAIQVSMPVRAERSKGVTAGTTNRYMALVKSILRRACYDWEWLDRVPKVGMLRQAEGRIRALTRDEFVCLLGELPEHLADMVRFSVATGLRQGNVTRVQWRQISLERRHLWVAADQHKNGQAHAVPLNELAMEVLLRRKGDHRTHVFTYEGKPVVQVNTKAWRNALERAGIEDFRWHDLRHTFATWHREAGTPTHELQRLGGWKTQSMVERYAHVAPEGLQFAASRLDNLLAVTRQ